MKSHEKAEPIESEYILINFMGYNNIIRLMTPVLHRVTGTLCKTRVIKNIMIIAYTQ
jgi:hypothetical protein